MTEQIVERLFVLAPQLGLLVLFLVSLALLLREYRNWRGEMQSSISDAVSSRLGSLMRDLQLELQNASKILDAITETQERVQRLSREFESNLAEKSHKIEETLSQIEDKLALLQVNVPESSEFTARDFVALAKHATSLGEALSFVNKARNDPDATSKDLEVAGDVARRFRRFNLALELYARAFELDSENTSARVENLCLLAEIDQARRDTSLEDARTLVVNRMQPGLLARLSNTLIELDRYSELQLVCEQVIANISEDNADIRTQALRDLAVALRNQSRLPEAETILQRAYESTPDNENLLNAYVSILRERKSYEKARTLAAKLLLLDPLDHSYYVLMGLSYNDFKDHEKAAQFFSKAEEMVPSGAEQDMIRREKQKAILRQQLIPLLEDTHTPEDRKLE